MKLDLIPLRDERRNCFEDALVSVIQWFERDSHLLFLKSWQFSLDWERFCKSNDCVISTYFQTMNEQYFSLMEQYCGIKVHKYPKTEYDIIAIAEHELNENRPLLASIDVYWCHWFHREYQKEHFGHTTIVIGYDKESKTLCCADTLPYNLGEDIKSEEFLAGCKNLYTFEVIAKENEQEITTTLKDRVHVLYGQDGLNAYDKMILFGNYVKKSIRLAEEVKGYENQLWNSVLFNNLHSLGQGRKNYANTLKMLIEQGKAYEYIPIYEMMEQAGLRWSAIRGIIAKAYYSEDATILLQRAGTKICELAEFEREIKEKIEAILEGNHESNQQDHMKVIEEINCDHDSTDSIDLSEYMNNQGFGTEISEDCSADFVDNGSYYLCDEIVQQETLVVNGIPFDIRRIGSNKKDNISCMGQQITFRRKKARYLCILGAAEWGNHFDKAEICRGNKVMKAITVTMSDWFFEPVFGESVAWIGKGAEWREGRLIETLVDVRLFCKVYDLENTMDIDTIILPNYPNMHIFAITLVS